MQKGGVTRVDVFKFYIDPLVPFKDKELIKYMNKRIEKDKGISYSDIRNILRSKYEGLTDSEIQEEKDSFFLRKTALQSAGIESLSSLAIPVMATFISAIAIIHEFIDLTIITYFLYFVLFSIILLYAFYEEKLLKRAREIAYCTLVLEVIKEIQPEIFNQ